MYNYRKKSHLLTFSSFFYLNTIVLSVIIMVVLGGCSSLPGRSEPITRRFEEAQKSFTLGESQYEQGQYQSALLNFESALNQFGSLDEREGVIRACLASGKSTLASGDGDRALLYYHWALPLAKDLNDRELIRDGANHLGNYYLSTGDLEQAEEWYIYTEDLPLKKSDVLSEYYRLGGTIAKRKGEYNRALELYDLALEIDKNLSEPTQIGINYYLQASAHSLMGNYTLAEAILLQALEKDRFYENLPGIAADLSALARVLEKSDRSQEALVYYKRAYLAWKGLGQEDKIEEIIQKIGNIGGVLIP